MSKKCNLLTPVENKRAEIRYWERKIDSSNTSTPKKHLRKWERIIKFLKVDLSQLTQRGRPMIDLPERMQGMMTALGVTTQKIPCPLCEGSGLQPDVSTGAKEGDTYRCHHCQGRGGRTGLKLVEENP